MKADIQIDLTYNQVLSLVRLLPIKDKLKLTKELEKEGIESKLSKLLKTFKTKELSLATINKELEIVRQGIYENYNH